MLSTRLLKTLLNGDHKKSENLESLLSNTNFLLLWLAIAGSCIQRALLESDIERTSKLSCGFLCSPVLLNGLRRDRYMLHSARHSRLSLQLCRVNQRSID